MPRGGSRSGAGRKAGAATKKTREIADKAASQGITPLEVMLGTMQELWKTADKLGDSVDVKGNGDNVKIITPLDYRMMASEVAQKAAPFVHAKLANVQVSGDPDGAPIKTVTRIELAPLDGDDSSH